MGFLKKIGIHDNFPTTKKPSAKLPDVPSNVSIQTNAGKGNTEITMTNEKEKNEMIGSLKETIVHTLIGIPVGIAAGRFIYLLRSKNGKKGLFVPWLMGGLASMVSQTITRGVWFLWKNR